MSSDNIHKTLLAQITSVLKLLQDGKRSIEHVSKILQAIIQNKPISIGLKIGNLLEILPKPIAMQDPKMIMKEIENYTWHSCFFSRTKEIILSAWETLPSRKNFYVGFAFLADLIDFDKLKTIGDSDVLEFIKESISYKGCAPISPAAIPEIIKQLVNRGLNGNLRINMLLDLGKFDPHFYSDLEKHRDDILQIHLQEHNSLSSVEVRKPDSVCYAPDSIWLFRMA